jgi:hypothetical protein
MMLRISGGKASSCEFGDTSEFFNKVDTFCPMSVINLRSGSSTARDLMTVADISERWNG